MSDNLQPNSSTARNSILKFAQSMVSNTIYRALQIILTNCCPLNVVSVTAVCDTDPENVGGWLVTFTFDRKLSFAGQGVINLDNSSLDIKGDLHLFPDDSNTITLQAGSSSTSDGGSIIISMPVKGGFYANLIKYAEQYGNIPGNLFLDLISPSITVQGLLPNFTLPTC